MRNTDVKFLLHRVKRSEGASEVILSNPTLFQRGNLDPVGQNLNTWVKEWEVTWNSLTAAGNSLGGQFSQVLASYLSVAESSGGGLNKFSNLIVNLHVVKSSLFDLKPIVCSVEMLVIFFIWEVTAEDHSQSFVPTLTPLKLLNCPVYFIGQKCYNLGMLVFSIVRVEHFMQFDACGSWKIKLNCFTCQVELKWMIISFLNLLVLWLVISSFMLRT